MGLSNGFTLSTGLEFFKRVYMGVDLSPLAIRRTPTLKGISKEEVAEGEGIVRPINLSLPVGATGTASKAVTNAYGSRGKRWILSTKNLYHRVNLDAKAMAVSKERQAAYIEAKRKEIDESLDYMGMSMERMLWDDGSGYVGLLTAASGGPPLTSMTFTLTDVINLHHNMVLQFNASRTGAGTPRNDLYRIDSINHQTGVCAVTRVSGSSNDVTGTDYAFVDGNRANVLTGITAYIPAADPSATPLNNVDRSVAPNMLAGWRGTNEGSIEESAKSLFATMGQYLNGIDGSLWLSYANWRKLEQELAGRAYRDEKSSARFGTGALIMQTPAGDIPVVAGPYVPANAGFFLDLAAVKLLHLRPLFHMRDEDGLSAVRLDWSGDEDGIGVEFRSWPELVIDRPMNCGRFPIS